MRNNRRGRNKIPFANGYVLDGQAGQVDTPTVYCREAIDCVVHRYPAAGPDVDVFLNVNGVDGLEIPLDGTSITRTIPAGAAVFLRKDLDPDATGVVHFIGRTPSGDILFQTKIEFV